MEWIRKVVVGQALALSAWLAVPSIPAEAETRYVWPDSPGPQAPYTSWDTAATSIQDAVDAAVAGDSVLVTNGVYATGGRAVYGGMANRVEIDRAISVRSVDGPAVTAIVGAGPIGGGAVRCVYVGTNAALIGFTLTNGHTVIGDSGVGGGVYGESSAVVSNCVLAGNAAYEYGGGSYGGMLSDCVLSGNTASNSGGGSYGGTLARCLLAGNRAPNSGGGASQGTLNGCGLTNNISYGDGGGSYGGTLSNCGLTNNFSYDAGGGAFAGTLNRCILYRNLASDAGGGAYGAMLRHCVGASNEATFGGGTYSGTLDNCTLAGNFGYDTGGGAYGGTLRNCIVYYNAAYTSNDHYLAALTYCCTPTPGGPGNITNAPQFVDSPEGNYRLLSVSACIDRGANAYAPGATDLAGNPRILNGRVDIGAYEYAASSLWTNAVDAGGGWFYLEWFGYFQNGEGAWGRWIWHTEHGWLYPVGATTASLWMWGSRLGCWLWTSDSIYPFLWSGAEGDWLWYYLRTGHGAGGWFYNYATGQVEWM